MNKIARRAGLGALCATAVAGYVLASLHGGPYAAAAVTSADPGQSAHAPGWLSFQRATAADRRHFGVRGKCVMAVTNAGHGWIVCRDGQSKRIPLDSPQPARFAVNVTRLAEPRRITLVTGMTGIALESLRWNSAGRATGQLDYTGEGAGYVGKVRVTVRRSAAGSITALKLAGDTQGIAKSWTFSHGHWSAA